MRRTILRYANLAFVITMTCISPCVKKRFPTLDHLVEAGLLLNNEKEVIDRFKTNHSMYWMPLVWASSITTRARKEGRIRDDFALKTIVDELAKYRGNCGSLFNYDWISIPLVYTQVTTLAVYTFFLATLMGRQVLNPPPSEGSVQEAREFDLYFPVFNFLQFFFYMGWLKVAETLVNPFGEDEDDFEMNFIIDRDLQVSYLIVDEMHEEHPELLKDQYWDDIMPADLPYTAASRQFYTCPPMGSAACLIVPPHKAGFVSVEKLTSQNSPADTDQDKASIPGQSVPLMSHLGKRLSHQFSMGSRTSLGTSLFSQKGPWNVLMQRFLSRDRGVGSSASIQSAVNKQSKMKPSISQNTSMSQTTNASTTPVSPQEQLPEFPDDIFHLSDLSLADSRSLGVANSPALSTMHRQFGETDSERSKKYSQQRLQHRHSFHQNRGSLSTLIQEGKPSRKKFPYWKGSFRLQKPLQKESKLTTDSTEALDPNDDMSWKLEKDTLNDDNLSPDEEPTTVVQVEPGSSGGSTQTLQEESSIEEDIAPTSPANQSTSVPLTPTKEEEKINIPSEQHEISPKRHSKSTLDLIHFEADEMRKPLTLNIRQMGSASQGSTPVCTKPSVLILEKPTNGVKPLKTPPSSKLSVFSPTKEQDRDVDQVLSETCRMLVDINFEEPCDVHFVPICDVPENIENIDSTVPQNLISLEPSSPSVKMTTTSKSTDV